MHHYCFVYKRVGFYIRKYILRYESKSDIQKIQQYCAKQNYTCQFSESDKKLPVDMSVKDFVYIDSLSNFNKGAY